MSNPFYNVSGAPTTGSAGLSSVIRSEFAAIAAGFALLPPTLTPNAVVVVNSGGTALVAAAAPSIGFGDGAVGTPSIYFTADTDSGIYRIGADDWALVSNGIKTLEITALNKVIVASQLGIGGDPASFPLYITANAASLEQFVMSNTTAGGGVGIELLPNTGAIILQMMGSTFGGTTYGNITGNSQAVLEADGASTFYIGTSPACPIIFAQNRAEIARFDNNGQLGIGITPAHVLDIRQSGSNAAALVNLLNSNSGNASSTAFQLNSLSYSAYFELFGTGFTTSGLNLQNSAILATNGPGGLTIAATADAPVIFAANNAEIARVFPAGGIGINTKVQSLFASSGFPLLCGLADSGGRGIRLGTSDWNNSNTGSFFQLEFSGGSGNVSTILSASTAGGAAFGNIVLNPSGGNVGIGKLSPAHALDIDESVTNASQEIRLTNSNAGNAANAALSLFNASHGIQLVMYGTGYTSSGIIRQDGALLYTNGAGGLTFASNSAPINFATNGIVNAELTMAGSLNAASGTLLAVPNNTFTTMFSASGLNGMLTLFAWLPAVGDVTNYGIVGYVVGDGSALAVVAVHTPALMDFQISGTNVQVRQKSGTTATSIAWAFTQMGA